MRCAVEPVRSLPLARWPLLASIAVAARAAVPNAPLRTPIRSARGSLERGDRLGPADRARAEPPLPPPNRGMQRRRSRPSPAPPAAAWHGLLSAGPAAQPSPAHGRSPHRLELGGRHADHGRAGETVTRCRGATACRPPRSCRPTTSERRRDPARPAAGDSALRRARAAPAARSRRASHAPQPPAAERPARARRSRPARR